MRSLFSLLRSLFLVYLVCMTCAFAWVACTRGVNQAMKPMCATFPGAKWTPFCEEVNSQPTKALGVANVTAPQERLPGIMRSVGQNHDLTRRVLTHRFAVIDLRVRVERSGLKSKESLASHLATLQVDTRNAARSGAVVMLYRVVADVVAFRMIAQFTGRVGRAIDFVIMIDHEAVKKIRKLEHRQNDLSSLFSATLSALSFDGGLRFSRFAQTEDDLKRVLLDTSRRIARDVKSSVALASELDAHFERILSTLKAIDEEATEELGTLNQTGVLASLWKIVARKEDYTFATTQSNHELLGDLTDYYHNARTLIRGISNELFVFNAELDVFQETHSQLHIDMEGLSLRTIAMRIQMSAERVQGARRDLAKVEGTE